MNPAEGAELSAVLDGHCAAVGRDPAQIRRSVQLRVPDEVGDLLGTVAAYVAIGFTDIILFVTADPVAQAERTAELLGQLCDLDT